MHSMPLDQIKTFAIQYLQDGNTIEELTDHILISSEELLDNEVNLSSLKEMFQPLADLPKTYKPDRKNESKEALDNLFNLHKINFEDEYIVVKNVFIDLLKYDKLIVKDGIPIPFLLDQLLQIIATYMNLLESWNNYNKEADTIKRTIALSTSNSPEKMLSPLKPYLKQNDFNNEKERVALETICEAYKNDSYEIDFALSSVGLLSPDNFPGLEVEQVNALFKSLKFMNSSAPVEKKDIINSLKIQISLLYLEDNLSQKALQLDKHVSKEVLASYIDVIIEYLLELKSTTSASKLGNPIQVRTNFDMVPLFEYTKKNSKKTHPAFKDEEFINELLEKFKG